MSSADTRNGSPVRRSGAVPAGGSVERRQALRLLGLSLLAGPLLAGCAGGGFRPMYASTGTGSNADEQLSRVDFGPIPGRVGQRIRNELVFQATGGGGQTAAPAFRFEVALSEAVSTTLVNRSGESLSQVYNLDASFRLIDLDSKKVVLTGSSFGRAAFERFTSIYANVRARDDAENRAARAVAADMRARLAAYLATRPA